MVVAIQTFGQLIHWNPHIHALVSEGVFLPDGTFLPRLKLAKQPFLNLWLQEVFALLLAEGKIADEVVAAPFGTSFATIPGIFGSTSPFRSRRALTIAKKQIPMSNRLTSIGFRLVLAPVRP